MKVLNQVTLFIFILHQRHTVFKKPNCLTSNFYPGINDIDSGDDLHSISKITSINKYQNVDLSLLGAILSVNICNFNNSYFRNYNIDENHKIAELDHSYFLKQINKKEKRISIYKFKELICDFQNIVELSYKPLSENLKYLELQRK